MTLISHYSKDLNLARTLILGGFLPSFRPAVADTSQAKEPTIMYPSIPLRPTNSFRRISINRSARQRRNILRTWAAASTLVFLLLASATAFADSATWTGSSPFGGYDWLDEFNWTPDTIPNGPADTATFEDDSTADRARVILLGSGELDISGHNAPGVTIGSIEGSGVVFLGAVNLTVGNNLSTTFSGRIKDGQPGGGGGTGGSLTKIGEGKLTLSKRSAYTGGTTINGGVLLATNTTGSATGAGAVTANAGTLGGSGIIFGAVTIGTGSGRGAVLAPAFGSNNQPPSPSKAHSPWRLMPPTPTLSKPRTIRLARTL